MNDQRSYDATVCYFREIRVVDQRRQARSEAMLQRSWMRGHLDAGLRSHAPRRVDQPEAESDLAGDDLSDGRAGVDDFGEAAVGVLKAGPRARGVSVRRNRRSWRPPGSLGVSGDVEILVHEACSASVARRHGRGPRAGSRKLAASRTATRAAPAACPLRSTVMVRRGPRPCETRNVTALIVAARSRLDQAGQSLRLRLRSPEAWPEMCV